MRPVITVQLAPCGCWWTLNYSNTGKSLIYTIPDSCPHCGKATHHIRTILRADNREDEGADDLLRLCSEGDPAGE